MTDETPDANKPAVTEVRYEYTPSLPEILTHLGVSLAITTYQAGKMLTLGVAAGKLQISFCHFDRAMGLAVDRERFAVGTRRQIHLLRGAHDVANSLDPQGTIDACWTARSSFYTGNIHGHELAWGNDGLWVVNTLFSTLCSLHEDYSFVPRWRPKFISTLAAEDRCHLNGMAFEGGQPRYVTAMSQTDSPAGWRPTKATTGCVIDVASQEVVLSGLAMPHSPRLFGGRLWVLNSGLGSFGYVDLQHGKYQPVEGMPGYTRGLAFAGQFAFVGLSKIRETSVFGGLPIEAHKDELKCGLGVVDLVSGKTVAVFQFHSGVEEIFAVDVIPGSRNPAIRGPIQDREDETPDVWICPPPGRAVPPMTRLPDYAREPQTVAGQAAPFATVKPEELRQQGLQLHRQGNLPAALASLEQAALQSPQPAGAWVDFGNALQDAGRQADALECYRKSAASDPNFVPAWQNLGAVLCSFGHAEAAVENFDRLQKLAPTPINRLLNGLVLPVVYDQPRDVPRWRERLETSLDGMLASGDHLDTGLAMAPTTFFLAYQGHNDRNILRKYGQLLHHRSPIIARPPRASGRKLKVGWLSAHFHDHTIGRLNIGRIERLNRNENEVYVIYSARASDAMAQRFQRAGDHFVPVSREITEARRQVRELGLDVLIFADVGMDAMTSSLAYSRMAPVQAVTWGHPQTTGSPEMDYFISSTLLEEATAQDHYTEQLVRLPHLGTYYERPVRTGPSRDRGHFGLSAHRRVYLCPQTLFKFHPDFDVELRGILEADPEGDLVCIASRVPAWQQRLMERWRRTLPDADRRVRFVPAQPRDDFLALLETADVMLDPPQFGGGNTSYEALALGVPVVTWPSPYLRGRITAALYRKLDYHPLICNSSAEYVAKALQMARDRTAQEEYRAAIGRAERLFDDPAEVVGWDEWLRTIRS